MQFRRAIFLVLAFSYITAAGILRRNAPLVPRPAPTTPAISVRNDQPHPDGGMLLF